MKDRAKPKIATAMGTTTQTPKKNPMMMMKSQKSFFSPRVTKFKSMILTKDYEEADLQKLKTLRLPEVWTEVMPFYVIDQKIGSGTYGTVVSAKCKQSNQAVAIKHIKDFSLYDYDCCKVIREIQIMSGLEEVAKNKRSGFFPQLLDIIVP